jgi:hypothetical protein
MKVFQLECKQILNKIILKMLILLIQLIIRLLRFCSSSNVLFCNDHLGIIFFLVIKNMFFYLKLKLLINTFKLLC